MGNCMKCGHELGEGSLFCNQCGAKTNSKEIDRQPKAGLNKTVLYGGIAAAAAVVIIVVVFMFGSDPVKKFMSAIESNEYTEASQIYEEKIKGNTEREKDTEISLKAYIDETRENFVTEKSSYAVASTKLETVGKTALLSAEVKGAQEAIGKLNDSRTAFVTGQELMANEKPKEALLEFKKVIEEDRNFAEAQTLIESSTETFKTTVLQEAEEFAAKEQYQEAMNALDSALSVVGEDADLSAKRTVYETKNEEKIAEERKKKMEEAKTKQEVTVERARIIVQSDVYKSLYPDMMEVVVRNQTSKTVKNMEVSMLAYDAKGLPIKIEPQFGFQSNYEHIGTAENVNITPNSTAGEDYGWSLADPHNIDTLIACVKMVEYYDGTTWENPYYEYWLEEYKEKPKQGSTTQI